MVPEFHRVSRRTKALRVADYTASGEFHPALKTWYSLVSARYYSTVLLKSKLFFSAAFPIPFDAESIRRAISLSHTMQKQRSFVHQLGTKARKKQLFLPKYFQVIFVYF